MHYRLKPKYEINYSNIPFAQISDEFLHEETFMNNCTYNLGFEVFYDDRGRP